MQWLKEGDEKARANSLDTNVSIRFIIVFGSVNQIFIEAESESIPERVYAEKIHNKNSLLLIVPGRSEMWMPKKIEI